MSCLVVNSNTKKYITDMGQYKFTFEGTPFEAETAAALAELYREVTAGTAVASGRSGAFTAKNRPEKQQKTQRTISKESETEFPEWVPDSSLKFLTAVANAGPHGADSETMMKALGINKPKALGGRSAMINRLIEDTGWPQSQVYDNRRTSAGRFWKARKHLPDALTEIQNRLRKSA
jgi:hypothetical protein